MTSDAPPGGLVVPIRPERALRGTFLFAAVVSGVLLIIAIAFTLKEGVVGALTALPCAAVFGAALWIAAWRAKRQLPGAVFRVDAAGMHLETKRSARTVAWADIEAVTVATHPRGGHAVLATLRPGVPKPAPGSFGVPAWSTELRCLVVMPLDLLEAAPEPVSTAVATHAGERFRPDGRL
ncbi:hypothetical protein ABZ671_30105 [Micromonospora sp. NPDC006766]|uniref:hypothetical protein n=1 Tax=Micromonospora sp. NPDC006766 TaxID=3154778 RepID=UPI00340343FE